jgi:hypothetical protein
MVNVPLPNALLSRIVSVPPSICVPPLWELATDSVSVPPPLLVSLPVPSSVPPNDELPAPPISSDVPSIWTGWPATVASVPSLTAAAVVTVSV